MYTPNQAQVYLAAFAGAIAGMASNRILGPTTPVTYATLAAAADAFAQSFDTQYGAVKPGTDFQAEVIADLCETAWLNVSPLPSTVSSLPSSYTAMCDSLIAMVDESTLQTAGEGIAGFGSEWTAYTPNFNTQNADGSLGDGVTIGFYKIDGDTLYYNILLQWGTTTNGGTGFFVLGLPGQAGGPVLPGGLVIDNSKMIGFGVNLSSGTAFQGSVAGATFPLTQGAAADFGVGLGNSVAFFISNSATGAFADAADPFAWANGDILSVSGIVSLS